ncbi:hypothetical protein HIM_05650 [Hirsutella minnesotensis 3608]|uniref:Uncharacterized protein n=1 Tax=Hirsutella minnesotensis 3608 TaxID=1043627 RepID=A0A0F8A591_9HYPO|nr:hypothetical protein HIM_05650 [Hirsutella minnesotensis 3608]
MHGSCRLLACWPARQRHLQYSSGRPTLAADSDNDGARQMRHMQVKTKPQLRLPRRETLNLYTPAGERSSWSDCIISRPNRPLDAVEADELLCRNQASSYPSQAVGKRWRIRTALYAAASRVLRDQPRPIVPCPAAEAAVDCMKTRRPPLRLSWFTWLRWMDAWAVYMNQPANRGAEKWMPAASDTPTRDLEVSHLPANGLTTRLYLKPKRQWEPACHGHLKVSFRETRPGCNEACVASPDALGKQATSTREP